MNDKYKYLVDKIKTVQIENPFVLVQGLDGNEYGLIESFVETKIRKNHFRNHDFYWIGHKINQKQQPQKDLIIYNFEVVSRFFPESAIEYAQKLIKPYIMDQRCIEKKGKILIFAKKSSEFHQEGYLHSTNFTLDSRISSFLERFKIINTNYIF